MNAFTRMSSKGQVVIPSDLRAAVSWGPGIELEAIRRSDGILLRARKQVHPDELDAALLKLRQTVTYTGPHVPESDWVPAIDAMIRQDWDRPA